MLNRVGIIFCHGHAQIYDPQHELEEQCENPFGQGKDRNDAWPRDLWDL